MEIYAKPLADSVNSKGDRLTSFEIQIPKVFLAEINTHSMLARNFSSSRAIPVGRATKIESFEPLFWGKNQAGMVSLPENIDDVESAKKIWDSAIESCKAASLEFEKLKLHKQWANRPNDWHVMAKGVFSGTEWTNFLWLRNHSDPQPEVAELARQIDEYLTSGTPTLLQAGEWHLPYITKVGNVLYAGGQEVTLQQAILISTSCCAQASYRTLDETLEKALTVYSRLNIDSDDKPKHVSPTEHQGTPMKDSNISLNPETWEDGVTHVRKDGSLWSAKFQGWIQHRQLIKGEARW